MQFMPRQITSIISATKLDVSTLVCVCAYFCINRERITKNEVVLVSAYIV